MIMSGPGGPRSGKTTLPSRRGWADRGPCRSRARSLWLGGRRLAHARRRL